jgi:hypoxanthine phosphoribosyltransferase
LSVPFAHASEAEMSRILDFYAVRWEYEPHTFPILWNLDGDVVESFAPDFYLPDLDLYLEMTTLRQKLVRKKNRKLRRLRELYPDLNIKLFYARDFRALMLKYGKLALHEGLSGSSGQVLAPHATPASLEAAATDLADVVIAVEPGPDVDAGDGETTSGGATIAVGGRGTSGGTSSRATTRRRRSAAGGSATDRPGAG